VLLIYLIARRLWGSEAGIVAAAIAAVFPPLVFLSVELMSESLFIALELGAVLAVLVYRDRPELRWVVLAGALCGLAALTRSNGIVLIVIAAAGVWILRPRWSLRALRAPALLAIVAALVIAPWTIRNYTSVGRFVPVSTQAGFSLAGTYNPTSLSESDPSASWRVPTYEPPYDRLLGVPTIDEATLHSIMRREATDFATDHPTYVAEATAKNLLRTFGIGDGGVASADGPVDERGVGVPFSDSESPALWVALLLAAIGALALLGRLPSSMLRSPGWNRGPLFVWLLPVTMIAVAIPIIGLPRYRAVADPFIVILAAIGLISVIEALSSRPGGSVNDPFGVEKTSEARGHSGRLESARPT
jgi:4-amino-4-deoxy-L-arabinose transferase-like glycosyltransferase